jgi:hypothetical protein
MSVRPWKLTLIAITAAAIPITISTAADAQSWHQVVKTDRLEANVDMQSLRWEGSKVTYRALFKVANAGQMKRTVIATATINCATHERQFVASEAHMADGSVRTGQPSPQPWRTIHPGSLTDKIQQIVCASGQ